MKTSIDIKGVECNEEILTPEERKDRIGVLNLMVDEGGTLPISKCSKFKTLDSLIKKRKLILDEEDKEIQFAYPVSGLPTPHHITLEDGREYYSMCAIDSLGSYFTFWQDLEINSVCSTSGEPIKVVVKNGEIVYKSSPDIHCIHVDLNKFDDWSASCWNVMNFFLDEKKMKGYFVDNELDNEITYGLSLDEAFKVGKKIFYSEVLKWE